MLYKMDLKGECSTIILSDRARIFGLNVLKPDNNTEE